MAKPIAVYVKGVGRLPIDGDIQKIKHETVPGWPTWAYGFQDGPDWVLVPVNETSIFVYDELPEDLEVIEQARREALEALTEDELAALQSAEKAPES